MKQGQDEWGRDGRPYSRPSKSQRFFFAIDIFAKSKLYRFSGKKSNLIDQACFNGSI
jgi:hypothetical protein